MKLDQSSSFASSPNVFNVALMLSYSHWQIAGDNEETSDRQPPTLPACRDTLIDDNDKQGGGRQLYFSQVSFDNEGIAETSLLSTPKTPEPIAESIEEPSPTVTTPDSRKKIKKRILKKHSPGKWPSGLKRKRENLLHRESEESQSSDGEQYLQNTPLCPCVTRS